MILVFCLDGATFDLLDPWIRAGNLPQLGELMDRGIRAELQSTSPPLTAPAWASFMTGKSPGGHGVFDFFRPDPAQASLVNSSDIRSRLFWEILSDHGITTGILNLPLTYPVRPHRGYTVPGLLSPGTADAVHPAGLLDRYRAELGPYRVTPDCLYRPGNEAEFVADARALTQTHIKYALRIFRDSPTDVAILHFLSPDIVQHKLWRFLDLGHPWFDPAESAGHAQSVLALFQQIDSGIREILLQCPTGATVLVVSDHGFGPVRRLINLNHLLLARGLLFLEGRLSTQARNWCLRNPFAGPVAWRVARWTGRQSLLDFQDIDWGRTRAYSRGHIGQVWLVSGGRPAHEALTGREYETLMAEVIDALNGLSDPRTGEAIPVRCIRTEAANPGPFSREGPDLLVVLDDYNATAYPGMMADGRLVTEQRHGDSGNHRPNGILIARGPAFKESYELKRARLVDLAPTLLHLAGVAVPGDMDGEVLVDALRPSYQSERPVVTRGISKGNAARQDLSGSEATELVDRLRRLGYLD